MAETAHRIPVDDSSGTQSLRDGPRVRSEPVIGDKEGAVEAPTPAPAVRHVAIIMDGNGRWAKARDLPRGEGHRAGVEAARRAVEAARDLGLECLTLYSFSTENWRRPAGEIRALMNLLREFIGRDLPDLKNNGVRVKIIGDRRNLDFELRTLVSRAERETASNDKFLLQIAFNYGGRDELVRAAQSLVEDARNGKLSAADVTEAELTGRLDTGDAPDPDLVIRTSGEQRISNFLLWQAAYAEYVFLDVLWPDFGAQSMMAAINEFCRRERRFGGVEAATPDRLECEK
ncbi:MAG: isoprenyl transferase [Pseudomonadota bacterium]